VQTAVTRYRWQRQRGTGMSPECQPLVPVPGSESSVPQLSPQVPIFVNLYVLVRLDPLSGHPSPSPGQLGCSGGSAPSRGNYRRVIVATQPVQRPTRMPPTAAQSVLVLVLLSVFVSPGLQTD